MDTTTTYKPHPRHKWGLTLICRGDGGERQACTKEVDEVDEQNNKSTPVRPLKQQGSITNTTNKTVTAQQQTFATEPKEDDVVGGPGQHTHTHPS